MKSILCRSPLTTVSSEVGGALDEAGVEAGWVTAQPQMGARIATSANRE
jgi:hypothetical protein